MKRLGITLLALLLLVLPAAAMALEVEIGDVILPDGKYMASGGNTVVNAQPSGGYAHLKDGVLTLKDYSISGEFDAAIEFGGGDLEIRLEGENSLTNLMEGWDGIDLWDQVELKIAGSGSLTIKASYGIWDFGIDEYGKVNIAGGKVIIETTETAICTDEVIISGGELIVKGEAADITVENLAISGGSVTVEGEHTYLYADNTVISGGTVKVVTGDYAALFCDNLSISGEDTVVDLTSEGHYIPAMRAAQSLDIASPLEILIPQEGSVENRGYYTAVDTDGNIASRVYIAVPSGNSGAEDGAGASAAPLPQTGDHSVLMLWAMLASLTGAGALLLRRREEN